MDERRLSDKTDMRIFYCTYQCTQTTSDMSPLSATVKGMGVEEMEDDGWLCMSRQEAHGEKVVKHCYS